MIGVSFHGCAGWLHRAEGNLGVVICPAHGFEELCSRRTLAVLAQRLADTGVTVLRFDYPGTADSAGDHSDPGQVTAWSDSIGHAIGYLRSEAAIERIVLIGLRIGGTLAALAGQEHDDVEAAVLLAPVVAGRTYVREMTALRRFIDTAPAVADAPSSPDDGHLTIGGFVMTPQTIEDVKALDLATLERIPSRLLVLPQPASVANERLIARLTDLAQTSKATVETRPFTGYDRMICEPTASVLPEDDLDTITDWVARLADDIAKDDAGMAATQARWPAPSGVTETHWREQGLVFGTHDHLVGVLCEPVHPRADKPAIVFLNNGMDYHAGWARQTVEHARALAAKGIASLRFDMAGIGDSRTAPGQTGDAIYREQAVEDARTAVELLVSRGLDAPVVTGGCSGAYTAYHLLRQDPRLNRGVIRNLQVFHWTPEIGYRVRMGVAAHPFKLTEKRRMADEEARPLDVVRSRVESFAIRAASRLRTTIRAPFSRSDRPLSTATDKTTREVLSWFSELSRRGARITLVYSEGDPGIAELERHTGPGFSQIEGLPGIRTVIVPGADHNLTPKHAREALLALFEDTLAKPDCEPR